MYEDRALERISEERHHSMSAGCESEHRNLTEQLHTLGEAILQAEEIQQCAELCGFNTIVYRFQELNTKVLIDWIVIYEKVTNPDGQRRQRVDIHYKFIGYMPVPIEVLMTPSAPEITITTAPDGEKRPLETHERIRNVIIRLRLVTVC